MRVLIFILLAFSATAQTGLEEIQANMLSQDSKFKPYDYQDFTYICPWQSVRMISHSHYQIDIRGTKQEILAVDAALVQRDLGRIWAGMRHETFELADRGYVFDMHTAIPYWPLQRWYEWEYEPEKNALDFDNCPSPCYGWYMHSLPNGLVYAIRAFGMDDYQISFVRFLKNRSGPKY